jgi:hypothetical protein
MKKQSKHTAENSEDKIKTMSFRIERVTDVMFTYTSLEKRGIPFNPQKIDNLIGWAPTIDKKSKEFKLLLTVNFVYEVDKENIIQMISYSNENVFSISNFKEVITNITKEKFDIDKNFVLNFLSVSISTARGLLISKLGNTEYSKIILQPVNANSLDTIYNKGLIK